MNSNQVLIIVDMQKDFVDPTGALTLYKEGQTEKLVDDIADIIKKWEGRIYVTMDSHSEDSCEFSLFPKHCVENTDGWALNTKIQEALKDKVSVMTLKKESFTGNNIAYINHVEFGSEFTIVGVCTHICVHDVVSSLVNDYKEANNEMPNITIYRNLVGDFNPEMEEFALKRMENLYGVKVI